MLQNQADFPPAVQGIQDAQTLDDQGVTVADALLENNPDVVKESGLDTEEIKRSIKRIVREWFA